MPLDWIMPAASTFTVPAAPPLSGEMTNRGPLDQSGLPVAKSLCHLLRLIVSAPAEARAPLQAVQRLRPVVDRRRLELQTILESSGAIKEYERGQEQLLHSAVAGLCHIARFCIDDSPDSTCPIIRSRCHQPAFTSPAGALGSRGSLRGIGRRVGAPARLPHGNLCADRPLGSWFRSPLWVVHAEQRRFTWRHIPWNNCDDARPSARMGLLQSL